jgi:hypothetical protein
MSGVERDIQKLITTKSDVPILGVIYDTTPAGGETMAKAFVSSEKAKPLYKKAMTETLANINASLAQLKNANQAQKYSIYTDLLTYLESYSKFTTVATLLDIQNIQQAPVTTAEVKAKLNGLSQRVNSIDLGAKLLLKGIDKKVLQILPAFAEGSHEVTPFGSVLMSKIAAASKAEVVKAGRYKLVGEYIVGKNELVCTYKLTDWSGYVYKTNVVTFDKSAYAGYRVKPQSVSFDKLLHQGMAVSSDFRIELATDKGASNLFFKKGEEVELLVKMNRPGYFYMAGHVAKPKEQYSYVLELNEGQGNRKFVYYVNGDMVNKWMSLGRFEIIPPFGVESLQAIASTKDLIANVPAAQYYDEYGIYMLDSDLKKGVKKTRALRPKKSKKVKTAEAVLMFTTM